MRTRFSSVGYVLLLACACAATCARTASAQIGGAEARPDERKPLQLALSQGAPPTLDSEQLRAQLERELGVVVVLENESAPADETPQLEIEAPSLNAVHVAFGESERTVDLSTAGPHAVETLALVAANLMRDEASDLLASLRATTPDTAPAPAPAPVAEKPAAEKPAPKPERRGCAPTRFEHVPFAANFVPRVGTSSFTGLEVEQAFAFNAIGGSAAALQGFELAGIFNHESYSVCGAQIAGGANLVSGPMEGFQLATLNMVDGRLDGGQLAFINTSSGTVHGFQVAFLNLALRGGDAVQVGFANVARESLSGVQAGFVNTTAGDSSGLQLGFVNVTSGRSRGLMLGMANVSADADAAIGLLNIYTKGRTQLDVWATDAGLVMVGVGHGGKLFHNIFGIGGSARSDQGVFAFAYGLGARAFQSQSMFLDVDAVAYGLVSGDETQENPDFGSIMQLRVPIGLRLESWFALYVSPALNLSVARNHENNALRDPGFYGARVTTQSSDVVSYIWPGVTLGARFF